MFGRLARRLDAGQANAPVLRLTDAFAADNVWREGLDVALENLLVAFSKLRDGVETIADRLSIDDPAEMRTRLIGELRGAPEPGLAEVIARLGACDLVIVEGYKSAAIPKIEVRRSVALSRETLADRDANVIAVAADHAADSHGLPLFSLDDIAGIADFIARSVGLQSARVGTAVKR